MRFRSIWLVPASAVPVAVRAGAALHQRRAALGEAAAPLPILSPSGSATRCLLPPVPMTARARQRQEPLVWKPGRAARRSRLPPCQDSDSLPTCSTPVPTPLASPGQARRPTSSATPPGHQPRSEVQHSGLTLFSHPCASPVSPEHEGLAALPPRQRWAPSAPPRPAAGADPLPSPPPLWVSIRTATETCHRQPRKAAGGVLPL